MRSLSRRTVLVQLVGVVAGILALGFALPYVVGDAPRDPGSAAVAAAPFPNATAGAVAPDVAAPRGVELSGPGPGRRAAAATAAATSGAAAERGGAPLTASDVGITPTTIKIGVAILDLGGLSAAGIAGDTGVTPETQRRDWQVFVDRLNRDGGVLGRRVVAVYRTYDILDEDTMRAACIGFTEDDRVFAVLDIGTWYGSTVLCVTEQHRTPLITLGIAGLAKDYYTRSRGLLFSLRPSGNRTMSNVVLEANRRGALAGRTIGILGDDLIDPGGYTVRAAARVLDLLGHPLAHHAQFSADIGTAASQIPIEVQRMRSLGVDTIFILTNGIYAAQFVQQASGQRWLPAYFMSDWNGETGTDVVIETMPDSFEGNIGFTSTRNGEWRVGAPEPAPERRCRQAWEAATNVRAERGSDQAGALTIPCSLLELFAAAGRAAGPDLTRDGLSASLRGLGHLDYPGSPGGSFGHGKFDGDDFIRTVRADMSCKCWKPVDAFRRPLCTSPSDDPCLVAR